jgi:hypothetical protein
MGVRTSGQSRYDRARKEAAELLDGPNKPSMAGLLLTNGGGDDAALHADMDNIRTRLTNARQLASGRASIPAKLTQAYSLLSAQTAPQKAIYVFTDLQRLSMEGLAAMPQLRADNIPIMLVDCSAKPPVNVGVADLQVNGRRIVDQVLEFDAMLVNSSPTDKVVDVWLQVDGRPVGQPVNKVLQACGQNGSRATVRFYHRFTAAGVHTGQVAISEEDDLPNDNARHFSMDIAGRAKAVLVRSPTGGGGPFDPAVVLQVALDPNAGAAGAWSVQLDSVTSDQFIAAALEGAQAVFLADLDNFTRPQALALTEFVRGGGYAVIFMGPSSNPTNYNDQLAVLLPGRIDKAVGQVGPTAPAVKAAKNLHSPYLADLFESPADYPEVLVQRYYRVAAGAGGFEPILSGAAGEPIASVRTFGAGKVFLFATTAGAEWNNLATTPLFLPIIARICLEAGSRLGADHTYQAGTPVIIQPHCQLPTKAAANVTLPDGTIDLLPLSWFAPAAPEDRKSGSSSGPTASRSIGLAASRFSGPAASFAKTSQTGIYRWQVAGAAPELEAARGAFAVNPDGAECDLTPVESSAVVKAVEPAAMYVGKSLDQVNAAATAAAAGDNLWDRLLAVAILLLVLEAVIANRFRPEKPELVARNS